MAGAFRRPGCSAEFLRNAPRSWQRNPGRKRLVYLCSSSRPLIPLSCGRRLHATSEFCVSEHRWALVGLSEHRLCFAPSSRVRHTAQLRLYQPAASRPESARSWISFPVNIRRWTPYGLRAVRRHRRFMSIRTASVGESEGGSFNFLHSRRDVRCFCNPPRIMARRVPFRRVWRMDGFPAHLLAGDETARHNTDDTSIPQGHELRLMARHPSALLIAEDLDPPNPGRHRPVDEGGLGSTTNGISAGMPTTRSYSARRSPDPAGPRDRGKLCGSLLYFGTRLPAPPSHDEVAVHRQGLPSVQENVGRGREKVK